MSAFSCASPVASALGTDASLGKQLVEHREDLRRLVDPPHREMRMRWCHFAVSAPQITVARQASQAAAHPVADLDIGKVLTQRQHLATQELHAAAAVSAVIVTVGSLCRIDVPAV